MPILPKVKEKLTFSISSNKDCKHKIYHHQSIDKFINNFQNLVKQIINQDRVDFVVISVEDWDKNKF